METESRESVAKGQSAWKKERVVGIIIKYDQIPCLGCENKNGEDHHWYMVIELNTYKLGLVNHNLFYGIKWGCTLIFTGFLPCNLRAIANHLEFLFLNIKQRTGLNSPDVANWWPVALSELQMYNVGLYFVNCEFECFFYGMWYLFCHYL